MNQSDIEVGRVLLEFDQVVEEYHSYLSELENLLELPEWDNEKLARLLRRIRKARKRILEGVESLTANINNLNDSKLKEEALGIMNYFYVVGVNDEINLLKKILSKDSSMKEDIEKDIEMLEKIRAMVGQFIY